MVSLDSLPTVFTTAQVKSLGVSERVLYQWRDNDQIEQVARGIYIKPNIPVDLDLVEIAIRTSKATLCLTTALARHDLSDDIPPTINVALPRQCRQPRTEANVAWHRFGSETFNVGREELELVNDLRIGIYSPTRCVIDAFRLSHLYGKDQANQALKRWLQKGGQASDLLTMTQSFPETKNQIIETLQILL